MLIYVGSSRLRQAEGKDEILCFSAQPGRAAHCHQEWAGAAFCDIMWVRGMQITHVGSALSSFAEFSDRSLYFYFLGGL